MKEELQIKLSGGGAKKIFITGGLLLWQWRLTVITATMQAVMQML